MSKLAHPTGSVTVQIDAAPEQVWNLVTDVTRIGEFSPETFEGKWTRGSTGPEVGATFAGHVKRNGVGPVYWSPCTVTVCEPPGGPTPATFEFSVGTDAVTLNNWGYRIESDGSGGSQVTEYFRLQAALPMRVYWLFLGWSRGRTNERGMRTTLERMKAVLEA
ncbi:MAG: SRPBCC family protein [Nocardioides sp.]